MATLENLTTPEVVKPTVRLELSLEEAHERINLLYPELERRLSRHRNYLREVEISIVELRSGTSLTNSGILSIVDHIRLEHITSDPGEEFLDGITMAEAKPVYDEISQNLLVAIQDESSDPEYLTKSPRSINITLCFSLIDL